MINDTENILNEKELEEKNEDLSIEISEQEAKEAIETLQKISYMLTENDLANRELNGSLPLNIFMASESNEEGLANSDNSDEILERIADLITENRKLKQDLKKSQDNENQLNEKQKDLEDKLKVTEDKQKEQDNNQKQLEEKIKQKEEKEKELNEKQKDLEDKIKVTEDKQKEQDNNQKQLEKKIKELEAKIKQKDEFIEKIKELLT